MDRRMRAALSEQPVIFYEFQAQAAGTGKVVEHSD